MSLPLTPPVHHRPTPLFETPPSDDSALYELSFDYEQNSAGEWHRVSKGRASPPTPVDKRSPPSTDSNLPPKSIPDDLPPPSSSRQSLTRSESLPGIPASSPTERQEPVTNAPSALRLLQRTLSGPVSLPQSTSQPSHAPAQPSTYVRSVVSSNLLSAGRSAADARRVTLDKFNERLKIQQQQQEQDGNDHHLQTPGLPQDEKENLDDGLSSGLAAGPSARRRYSPPLSVPALSGAHYLSSRYSSAGTTSSNARSTLADVVPPQRPSLPMSSSASITRQLMAGPSRLARVQSLAQKKFARGLPIDKISEVETVDDDTYADPALNSETDGGGEEQPYARSQAKPQRQRVNALAHSSTRPRRSASLSDASSTSYAFPRLRYDADSL